MNARAIVNGLSAPVSVSVVSLAMAFLLVALVPGRSAAQDEPPAAKPAPPARGICAEDAQRLCADAGPGRARARCLREHRDELSPACRERMETAGQRPGRRQRAAKVLEACADETARLCADRPGRGGLIRCLRTHESELSDGCREALPARGPRGPRGPAQGS